VAVIGLGLIGGSLGMALRRRGICVSAYNRNPVVRRQAVRRGAASRVFPTVHEAVRGADLVVICVPVPAMPPILREAGLAAPGAVITDTGSVKQAVLEMVDRTLPGPSRFVGGHPMAGSERRGLKAARPDLFKGRTCILTPVWRSRPGAVSLVAGIWRLCGARVLSMDARKHDRMVAGISHLPHALALALMNMASRDRAALSAASGSFLDATRVSASDPEMWCGIFKANREEVLRSIAAFGRELAAVRRALAKPGGARLLAMLRRACSARARLGSVK